MWTDYLVQMQNVSNVSLMIVYHHKHMIYSEIDPCFGFELNNCFLGAH